MVAVGGLEDGGGMHQPELATPSPRRPGPRWWWVVLVQLVGTYAAVFLGFVAMFSLPRYGLFGVENDAGTRAAGLLAAVGAVVGVLSGPLFVHAVRRWRGRGAQAVSTQ